MMLCGSFAFACMGTLAHEVSRECDWPVVALARSLVPLVLVGGICLAGGVPMVWRRPRAEGRLDLDFMVTKVIGLEDVEPAFRDMKEGKVIRSVIRMTEES